MPLLRLLPRDHAGQRQINLPPIRLQHHTGCLTAGIPFFIVATTRTRHHHPAKHMQTVHRNLLLRQTATSNHRHPAPNAPLLLVAIFRKAQSAENNARTPQPKTRHFGTERQTRENGEASPPRPMRQPEPNLGQAPPEKRWTRGNP